MAEANDSAIRPAKCRPCLRGFGREFPPEIGCLWGGIPLYLHVEPMILEIEDPPTDELVLKNLELEEP
jgi:hypothetical protein